MSEIDEKEGTETIGRKGMQLGLEQITRLLQQLGNPQKGTVFIHVAGTNGKGSVIASLSEILVRAGYKTGAYLSPAVFDPLELYRINGQNISRQRYEILAEQVRQAILHMKEMGMEEPTQFEAETALAFCYFAQEACDLVLLETGLGGRLDATNCIEKPLCAILTSINRDHMAVLGESLEEIAGQKAGIIKKACDVVSSCQEEEAARVIRQVCHEKQARLVMADSEQLQWEAASGHHKILRYKDFMPVEIGLLGRHQLENAAVVLETVRVLQGHGYHIKNSDIEEGLKAVRWPGRLTILNSRPLVMMDGAHNEQAALCLAEVLKEDFRDWQWIFIMGVLADKDYPKMIVHMADYAEKIITITPDNERALAAETLAEVLRSQGHAAGSAESLKEAVKQAAHWCRQGDQRGVLAFGSFTFLKEFQEAVEKSMLRLNQLICHPLFLERMDQIEQMEKQRPFCRHGWEHCMDVARTMAFLNEERKLGLSRELLYALALVHDLGRVEEYQHGIPHNEAGAVLAEKLLQECGFDSLEIACTTEAVRSHRDRREKEGILTSLLIEADKKTRPCFRCRAREQCKWPENKKNRMLEL